MATATMTTRTSNSIYTRLIVLISGIFYALTGLALLFLPTWFYTNVGTFPPFNRHYTGDVGAFALPLGIGMMLAWRDPRQHRLVIGVAAGVSVVHALNHLYDDFFGSGQFAFHLSITTISLIILAIFVVAAAVESYANRSRP